MTTPLPIHPPVWATAHPKPARDGASFVAEAAPVLSIFAAFGALIALGITSVPV